MRIVLLAAALLAATPTTPATPLRQVVPAVLAVETPTGNGTGFLIAESMLLTAAHVVEGETTVRLRASDGSLRSGTVSRVLADHDLALVTLHQPLDGVSPLEVRESAAQLGEPVFAIGYSLATKTPSIMHGMVSAARTADGIDWIQTDTAVNPGMSGGPLLDESGELVGMVVSRIDGAEGSGVAVGGSVLRQFVAGDLAPGAAQPDPADAGAGAAVPLVGAVAAALLIGGLVVRAHQDEEPTIQLGSARRVPQPEPPREREGLNARD